MPPFIPSPAAPSITRASAGAARWAVQQPLQVPAVASFSTTASRPKFTKARRLFRAWEKGPGSRYRTHEGQSPNYLGNPKENTVANTPFPFNPAFRSANVLSDSARELIWKKVMQEGETIKAVSAEYGVDIRRVAAVVRLKEVEKDWIAKGKQLAKPYAKAVLAMLPTFHLEHDNARRPFESINELHVHPQTMQQVFWPTSESRHFTREDAAKAFHPTLLSADKRVPHPELIQMEKEVEEGRPLWDASERFKQAVMESERKAARKQMAKAAHEEKQITRVNTERFEFRFKQFNAENVGLKGKSRDAVGWRYGTPYDDRAKGHELKIPTSVP
ncbi:eukaryotic mitochondrial regulator protein-domain-containing protein [Xylaria palmicola]|nr:eukaryotic mitochondrial regulator protein-domain-containing protein [Xylaria palmicola]